MSCMIFCVSFSTFTATFIADVSYCDACEAPKNVSMNWLLALSCWCVSTGLIVLFLTFWPVQPLWGHLMTCFFFNILKRPNLEKIWPQGVSYGSSMANCVIGHFLGILFLVGLVGASSSSWSESRLISSSYIIKKNREKKKQSFSIIDATCRVQ